MIGVQEEYTVSQMAELFGQDSDHRMRHVLTKFAEHFPPPTAPRPIPGSRMLGRYYPGPGVVAVYRRFEMVRQPGESLMTTFRRMFNVPKKTTGRRPYVFSTPRPSATAALCQEVQALRVQQDQLQRQLADLQLDVRRVLEIMQKLS